MMEFMKGSSTYYRAMRLEQGLWKWVGPVYYNSTDAANYLGATYPKEVGTGSLKIVAMPSLEQGEEFLKKANEDRTYEPTPEEKNRLQFVKWMHDTGRGFQHDDYVDPYFLKPA